MATKRTSNISATEARVHFGKIMQRAENGETLVVERSGQPKAVIISIDEYMKLKQHDAEANLLEDRLLRVRERYLREAKDVHYDVEEDIRRMSEERANELDSHLR